MTMAMRLTAESLVGKDWLDITEKGRLNTWLGFNSCGTLDMSFSDCLEVLRPRIASL